MLFAGGFCFWCILHLAWARWALDRLRKSPPGEIDMDYIRAEDLNPREVREGRRSGATHFSSDAVLDENSIAGATVADGVLTILSGACVTDFVDSVGEMKIGENCVIEGRATSATAIRLSAGTSVRTCFAPEITTCAGAPRDEFHAGSPSGPAVTSPTPRLDIPEGMALGRLRQLSADTWICTGDLESLGPVFLRTRLVVLGVFSAGAGSELFEDLKATGNLSVGRDSVCHGRLVSGAAVTLGAGCRFERVVYATGDLRLGPNVRGEGSQAVAAYAAGRIFLSPGIVVCGKIASDLEVVSLP